MSLHGLTDTTDAFLAELRTSLDAFCISQSNSMPDGYKSHLATTLSRPRNVDELVQRSQLSRIPVEYDRALGLIKAAEQDLDEYITKSGNPNIGFSNHPDGSYMVKASSDSASVQGLLSGNDFDSTSSSDDDKSGTDEEYGEGDDDDEEEDEVAENFAGALVLMNHDGVCITRAMTGCCCWK